ncbi:ADP-ribosylglycohydrolase family protein [Flavobacteriaceae bacterium F89]|uniref:ADP-ribosylglycohydrolase family protein n=1 Tax=Cerina litoralis TaxID=2874477 RepID=A0AAE3ESZ8_9FLAO|nr:ADP-ribosylglycohydrolase family protein [Cerina litoralis]MCG2459903.1 ADP-ribosylglycohydrolase family protein [Cerina litoralis]
MLKISPLIGTVFLVLVFSCKRERTQIDIPIPTQTNYGPDSLKLSKEAYHDKVLGALVGSAIGDAMGASTEMWDRKDIRTKYGYITGLTAAVRERSPEGTWDHNLSPGASTDDTRWKFLMTQYIAQERSRLNAENFARFITGYYQSLIPALSDSKTLKNPDLLDQQMEKVDWIKEWARVALAYQQGPEAYQLAQNRFYGGEMSCAGMLYTPMLGLITANVDSAYRIAYKHSLFDIGYAKDISALVAAMTNMALHTRNMDSILNVHVFVDPFGYQDSRLVGRIPHNVAAAAEKEVTLSKTMRDIILTDTLDLEMPKGYPGDPIEWDRQAHLYEYLKKNQKAIPFHAGEIWETVIAALKFGEGDFNKTLQFVINYGRDNDTAGAVAGFILGARNGFSGLPKDLRDQSLEVNRELMGIDLEDMAKEIVGDSKQ